MDVLFRLAYDQMGLPLVFLKPIDALLYGFFSYSVQPNGRFKLLITTGNHPA